MAAPESETVSPSLLDGIEPMAETVPELQVRWEDLISDLPSSDGEMDKYLLIASQQYECETEADVDELLVQAASVLLVPSAIDPPLRGYSERFGAPRSSAYVEKVKKNRVPKKTRANTAWSTNIWREWAGFRQKHISDEEHSHSFSLDVDITMMDRTAISFWLQRFVLEVRKGNGEHYCPDSLYQLSCGLQRALRCVDLDINFFEGFDFSPFRSVLDGELKRLNSTGKYIHKKKASIITLEIEDILRNKGILGDRSPQVLCDTMVYLIGLFFALRSGEEHRRLRHRPSQFELVEPPDGKAFLKYKEDMSKSNQAGLQQRKVAPKEVVQYANHDDPARCIVRLYKLYNSFCPHDRPDSAFYLTPLARPKENCWFKKTPLGHCKLAEVVPRLMKSAGVSGYFTNHSLRATATTRLYDAQVDEATIMERTGHRSTDGVRAYKRSSEKLRELPSNVLNRCEKMARVEKSGDFPVLVEGDENKPAVADDTKKHSGALASTVSGINFGNASNFTINFKFN